MQREGRAGRTCPGECWHLLSSQRYEMLQEYLDPEIQREPLEDVILKIKSLNLPIPRIENFMDFLVEPPVTSSVKDALLLLRQIEAIDENEQLTLLGSKLAMMPLNPLLSKMAIMAALFKCLNPILSIVSVLNEKDPFVLTAYKQRHLLDKARQNLADGEASGT